VKRIGGGFDVVDEGEYRKLEEEGKVANEQWRPGFQPALSNSKTMGPAGTMTSTTTTTPPPPPPPTTTTPAAEVAVPPAEASS